MNVPEFGILKFYSDYLSRSRLVYKQQRQNASNVNNTQSSLGIRLGRKPWAHSQRFASGRRQQRLKPNANNVKNTQSSLGIRLGRKPWAHSRRLAIGRRQQRLSPKCEEY